MNSLTLLCVLADNITEQQIKKLLKIMIILKIMILLTSGNSDQRISVR